ncbi:UTP--glucose-1-phosphate uridylyltransferase GalU [Exiguobacterium mexicanum]|uniref:UTP--glucose-1-phosphate uridylyltransferase n=1 Tax=Exiguobacterium mexicanum TaxID=340146 RepID=A0ABT7MMQ5_9BACL|nr:MULTISPECIES: UTP--glucose-1-phosphate uridylyltransferase GalU [Exiguobacterium]MDL5376467.1 UTP--glucose-1-phosphate uridylyltransferase GalU [Exiguobacterium mexicanum]
MKKIRKAIIPAAGLGTRFLPATKATPKEMLPILTKPTIQYIVEEAVASGIEQIIIVTGRNKRAIEDHFDSNPELESQLRAKEKYDLLEKVQASSQLAEIHYIRQQEPKGLGHAIWSARHFIGDEPFAVLLGDDLIVSEKPGLQQLIEQYEKTESAVIGVQEVPDDQTHRYGVINPLTSDGRLYDVKGFVEKPAPGTSPSNLAIVGRYVLTPQIFRFLERQEVGAGGEIQLTDAINYLNGIQRVFAYNFEGKRFDVGEKLGYVETTLAFALQDESIHDELAPILTKYLKEEFSREQLADFIKELSANEEGE